MLIRRPRTNYLSSDFLSNQFDNAITGVFKEFFPYPHDNHEAVSYLGRSFPKTNIARDKEQLLIKIAAPGFSKSDFDITLEGNTLTIKVDNLPGEKIDKWIQQEFTISTFAKSWTVPSDLSLEAIDADYTSGLLTVTIPAKEKKAHVTKKVSVT